MCGFTKTRLNSVNDWEAQHVCVWPNNLRNKWIHG